MQVCEQDATSASSDRPATLDAVGVGVALMLSAFSLRPALASVGALLDEIRGGLGMSATLAGVLTAVPSAGFAVVGTFAPKLSRRRGPGVVIAAAMTVVGIGLAGRALAADTVLFLLGSGAAVVGIGVGNVVMPAAVRHYFPDCVGLVTGLYSMSLTAGAALSAAVSVPAADRFGGGWRLSLGLWALPAVAAALVWFAVLRRAGRRGSADEALRFASAARPARAALLHSRTAWALSVFFGLQAAGAYVVLGWLPQILRDAGVAPGAAGLLLALTPTVGIPFAFLIPSLAARLRDQSMLVVGLGVVGLAGYAGLWLAPAATPWAWAVLLGISQAAFPLALTMIGLRGGSTGDVARLSAFAQGVGYLIATPGPLLFGALNQYTHGWSVPLAFMATLLVAQIVVGRAAGHRSGTPANRAAVTGGRSGRT